MEVIKGQRYRHYKGREYRVLSVGHHSESGEKMVVYQGEYIDPEFGDYPVWIRPYSMFTEEVTVDGVETPRFTLIE